MNGLVFRIYMSSNKQETNNTRYLQRKQKTGEFNTPEFMFCLLQEPHA